MKKIIPLVMLLVGLGAGVGAGVFLRPEPVEPAGDVAPESKEEEIKEEVKKEETGTAGMEYIKLSNQFVVPIVENDRVSAMVVMTLSVEVPEGQGQEVFDLEPKIRDVFLRVLFDHATIGGFDGAFLNNDNLDVIRKSLRDAAFRTVGQELINDVLIFEIARQDY